MAWKGYENVQTERAQTANQPGQVVNNVAALPLSVIRVLQQDAQAVCRVPQDDQRKEEK